MWWQTQGSEAVGRDTWQMVRTWIRRGRRRLRGQSAAPADQLGWWREKRFGPAGGVFGGSLEFYMRN